MTTKTPIGFCGLGAMGFGMAAHLVSSGHSVTGFDVYAPSLERFKVAGGIPSTSLSESARDKPFYIVMVASAPQAEPALFADEGIVKALPQGATLMVCSTVASTYIKSVESKLRDMGRGDVLLIDAPVSGGAKRAADGTLTIMAGGSAEALAKGEWLLKEMSAPEKLFVVEGGIGQGSNMKMVHQVLAANQILSTSEAFGFAARLGLNGKDVFDAVLGSQGWSWMFENRGPRTLSEDYVPGVSAVTIIIKDTGIITYIARSISFSATMVTAAEQAYFAALDRGWGAEDDAGIVRLWTSEPVSNVQSNLPAEDKQARLGLVVDLLTGIHLVSAAEALSLAKTLAIPLPQFYQLACDAAGGSAMYKTAGAKMIDVLDGKDAGAGSVLGGYAEKLKIVVDRAQEIKCPLFLGSAALNVLLRTGPELSIAKLLDAYGARR